MLKMKKEQNNYYPSFKILDFRLVAKKNPKIRKNKKNRKNKRNRNKLLKIKNKFNNKNSSIKYKKKFKNSLLSL